MESHWGREELRRRVTVDLWEFAHHRAEWENWALAKAAEDGAGGRREAKSAN